MNQVQSDALDEVLVARAAMYGLLQRVFSDVPDRALAENESCEVMDQCFEVLGEAWGLRDCRTCKVGEGAGPKVPEQDIDAVPLTLEGEYNRLFVGVGIPIPLLDEELAHDVSIRNEQITTNILDFGEEERPIGQTNYAELRSGSIEVRGQRVRTAPVASLRKAREIAETLKGWIARGEFLLTEPVQPMPAHSTVKGLKADDE